MGNKLYEVARKYVEREMAVIPLKANKVPLLSEWEKYQTTTPTIEEIEDWFASLPVKGLGLILGHGNTVIDFDDASYWPQFQEKAKDLIQDLPVQKTGKGFHLAFNSSLPIRNKKLVMTEDGSTAIETRGVGGYVVIAPSLHGATGKHYENLEGSFLDIPTIRPEIADQLLEIARSLSIKKTGTILDFESIHTDLSTHDRKIIKEYNRKNRISDLLERHGYQLIDGRYLAPNSSSGNPGLVILSEEELCFSHHGDALGDGKAHDAFDVFRYLDHGKDWKAAIEAATKSLGLNELLMPKLIEFDLLSANLPEPNFIVPKYLPEGLTILAGKPKIGKSWMALGLALSVARGLPFLDERCCKGQVFYFALEDNQRRLKTRLQKLMPFEGQLPDNFNIGELGSLEKLDSGGLHQLGNLVNANPDTKLIVIDTLVKVKPQPKRQNTYEEDSAVMGDLQKITSYHGIALIVVHHVRKMESEDVYDTISGSMGLQGVADTMWVLTNNRSRDKGTAELSVKGRDLEEDLNLALKFNKDTAYWESQGDAAMVRISLERQSIIDVLQDNGGEMSPTTIASELGKKRDSVKALLNKMKKDGFVDSPSRGKYKYKPPFSVNVNGTVVPMAV